MLNFRYSLTGYDNAAYAFGYYQTQEEKAAAAEMIKADFLPHLSQNLLPYSVLLVNGIREALTALRGRLGLQVKYLLHCD